MKLSLLFGLVVAVMFGCAAEVDETGYSEPGESVVGEEGELGEVEGALVGNCLDDSDCGANATCNTRMCLSCCPPGVPCIAACCGRCQPMPAQKPCAKVLCIEGFVPVTDANGCDHGCRPARSQRPQPPAGEACGPTVCEAGQVCCNESCGICTPPGGFCIQLFCGREEVRRE